MGSPKKPSPAQAGLFEKWGLQIPESARAAQILTSFIIWDEKSGYRPKAGWTHEKRVKLVKEAQNQFLGKRVCHSIQSTWIGTVKYLSAEDAVREYIAKWRQAQPMPDCFKALVVWENDKPTSYVGLRNLLLQ